MSTALNAAEWMLQAGARRPDVTAIRFRPAGGSRDLSYRELRERVARTAAALLSHGLEPERRVLVALPDVPELIGVFLGAMWAGVVPILVNPGLRADDYRAFVLDFRPHLLLTSADIASGLADLGVPALTAGLDGSGTLRDAVERAVPLATPAATHADDPAFWLLSSGTTGRPKGVIHLHRSVSNVCAGYGREILALREDDVCYATSKTFFAYGLGASVYLPLAAGATAVLSPEPFTAARTWTIVARERPSLFFAVPSVYRALADAAVEDAREVLSSVRVAVSAGESLPEALFDEWRRRFGVEILDGIGSTEALHIFISNRPGRVKPGSTGTVVPGYEARIVDEDGVEAGPRQIGNLLLKGPSTFAGYWNRRDRTRQTVQGEWIATGDKYYRDEEGYYWFCGRSDDMLKVGGIWVSPAEVEGALVAHPAVLEAAVVGQEDGDGLVKPKAFVVLRDATAAVSEDELKSFVRSRLAPYKAPRSIVFLSELPKTPTGKIQRFKLRQE
jgi:benzoate-CoA ligase